MHFNLIHPNYSTVSLKRALSWCIKWHWMGGKKCPFGVLSDAILIFSTCFSFTHKCSLWPVHGNQWAKTINIFMHGSQETSATLSADQFTDRVNRADPNHSHVGCIHRSCGKMALQWLHLVIPALSEPKAISHAMLERNKHSYHVSPLNYKYKHNLSDEGRCSKSCNY